MYTVRLYCDRTGRKNLSRYDKSETQIIRLKENNTTHIKFKMYDYCNNYYSTNKPFSWLVHNIPNNRFTPNMYATNSNIKSILIEIRDIADNVIHEGQITKMIGGRFDMMIPPLTRGNYSLIVTYTTLDDDVVSKTFPIVITH